MAKSSSQVVLEQYLADFPFVQQWIKGCEFPETTKFKVERIDLDVLAKKPTQQFEDVGSGPPLALPLEQFFLIGKDGNVLCSVKEDGVDNSAYSFWHLSTWSGRRIFAQTVQEAMIELGAKIVNLEYVVCVDNRSLSDRKIITIYKLPKSFSLLDFLKQEEQRIKDQVRQQIDRQ